jgi:hypothetical protein
LQTGLLSVGGQLLAQLAAAEFDGAEQFAVGGIDEGIDHLLQEGLGGGPELFEEALAALGAGLGDFRDRRSG